MTRSPSTAVWWKVAATLLALVVGSGTGLASTAMHDKNWAWFLLAVAAPSAATWALPPGWLRIGFATGWIVLLLLAVQGTPAGSYAVSADLRGYAFLGCGLVLMVAAIVSIPVPRTRRAAPSESEPRDPTT